MYCKKCGAQIKEGKKFCQNCGSPVELAQGNEVSETGETTVTAVPKKRHAKMIVVILVILAVAIAAAAFVMNQKPTIDLNKYTTISYEGYDGQGKAEVSIDYGAIDADYAKKVKVMTNSETFWFVNLSVGEVLSYLAKASIDVDTGLSNGDQITVSYQTDDEKMKEVLDCKIKCRDEILTVEGLEEIQTIDVFTGLELDFTGTAPHGKASVNAGGLVDQAFASYSWVIEPDMNLSNGDTVTVSMEVYDESAFMQEFGGMPKETSRTYTVAGLDSYITDMSQLSSENIEALKKEAIEQIEATCANEHPYIISTWINKNSPVLGITAKVGEFTLENIYFLIEKDSNVIKYPDYVSAPVFVYSATAKIFKEEEDQEFASGKLYFTVSFTDLVLEEGGNLVGTATNSVERYNAIDEAYKTWVTGKKDNYIITIYDANLKKIDS